MKKLNQEEKQNAMDAEQNAVLSDEEIMQAEERLLLYSYHPCSAV